MKSFQKSYLRGIGQTLRPAIHVGKKGADEAFLTELSRAFDQHELIKVKFAAFKEKKEELTTIMAEHTGATVVGAVGNTALFYRENPDPAKREIRLPERPTE